MVEGVLDRTVVEKVGPHPYDPDLGDGSKGGKPKFDWFVNDNKNKNPMPPLSPELRFQGAVVDLLGPQEEAREHLGDLWNYVIGKRAGLSEEQLDRFGKLAEYFHGLDRLEEALPGIMKHNLKARASDEREIRKSLATADRNETLEPAVVGGTSQNGNPSGIKTAPDIRTTPETQSGTTIRYSDPSSDVSQLRGGEQPSPVKPAVSKQSGSGRFRLRNLWSVFARAR